ncbi:MAG: hypothetical protein KKA81_03880 [Bacteroidetes bacterium]|nr:hypothetical protein [Bacteroidota bacterium]
MKTIEKFRMVGYMAVIAFMLPLHSVTQTVNNQEEASIDCPVNASTQILFENKTGELEIQTWDKLSLNLKIFIEIKGDQKDVNATLEAIRKLPVKKSNTSIEINTQFYENWSSGNFLGGDKIKLTLHTGTKVSLDKLKVNYILTIPENNDFKLVNKYEDVMMADFSGKAELLIYDCDFHAGNFSKDLKIELKYSSAKLGNLGSLFLTSYDSKAEIEVCSDLKLNSKYSELDFGKTGNISLNVYDDKVFIDAHGDITGEAKYTTLFVHDFASGNLVLYDCTLKGANAGIFILKAKYTKIEFLSIENLDFQECYDNTINVGSLGNIDCLSKYTTFTVNELKGSFKINSYDDNISIGKASQTFKGLEIESKYSNLSISLPHDLPIILTTDTKYTNLTFPKDKMQEKRYHKDDSEFQYIGFTKDSEESKCIPINISAYDGQIEIK